MSRCIFKIQPARALFSQQRNTVWGTPVPRKGWRLVTLTADHDTEQTSVAPCRLTHKDHFRTLLPETRIEVQSPGSGGRKLREILIGASKMPRPVEQRNGDRGGGDCHAHNGLEVEHHQICHCPDWIPDRGQYESRSRVTQSHSLSLLRARRQGLPTIIQAQSLVVAYLGPHLCRS